MSNRPGNLALGVAKYRRIDPAGQWVRHAACAGLNPELFHPTRQDPKRGAAAVCATCRVRNDCLDWAIATNQTHGIWGGLTAEERDRLRLQRKRASA